tara:strand:- start:6473 stop:7606 length:1134 start_codon:yes stop_codon:yes gene_type:complete
MKVHCLSKETLMKVSDRISRIKAIKENPRRLNTKTASPNERLAAINQRGFRLKIQLFNRLTEFSTIIDSQPSREELAIIVLDSNGFYLDQIAKLIQKKTVGEQLRLCRQLIEDTHLNFPIIEGSHKSQSELLNSIKRYFSIMSRNFKNLDNWSSEEKLFAVKQDGHAIQYFRQQATEDIMLAAVSNEPKSITHFAENASSEIRLEAIRRNPSAIKYFANPTLLNGGIGLVDSPDRLAPEPPTEEEYLLACSQLAIWQAKIYLNRDLTQLERFLCKLYEGKVSEAIGNQLSPDERKLAIQYNPQAIQAFYWNASREERECALAQDLFQAEILLEFLTAEECCNLLDEAKTKIERVVSEPENKRLLTLSWLLKARLNCY